MLSNYPIKNSVILMKASSKNKNNEEKEAEMQRAMPEDFLTDSEAPQSAPLAFPGEAAPTNN